MVSKYVKRCSCYYSNSSIFRSVSIGALTMRVCYAGPLPTPVTNEPPTAMKSVGRDTDEGEGEEEDEEAIVRRELLLRHIHNLAMMSHAEKSTLYALMNHLKKVAMHNRHNKMNCQNLAVCFGPVLLGPTNTTGGSVLFHSFTIANNFLE